LQTFLKSLLPYKKYKISLDKQRILDFARFVQYDIIASLLGVKKIAKIVEKFKEEFLKLETQFRKIIL
jgi:hypothetical protein